MEVIGKTQRGEEVFRQNIAKPIKEEGVIYVSSHLDKLLGAFQKSEVGMDQYFCGQMLSQVELLAFFQEYLNLSIYEMCSIIEKYNLFAQLELQNQMSYVFNAELCQKYRDFLSSIVGEGDHSNCLCSIISTNRVAYFTDNIGTGINQEGCSVTQVEADCRQFELIEDDDDLVISFGRLGAAKSMTMVMQYDGCDSSPDDFEYSLRASGAAIAFRSVCIDPITLSGNLENCKGCVKEIILDWSYAGESEIWAKAGSNIGCTGESIEMTAEDWAFLMVSSDDKHEVIDTSGRKHYVNCNNDQPSLDTLITSGLEIVDDITNLLGDFSVGGLTATATAITSYLQNELFPAPCQTFKVEEYNLLSGSHRKFELKPGGYFQALMASGLKFAGKVEDVGDGFVTVNGDFFMTATLRTKVDSTGIIPDYCICEKIGAYVLGSLKDETPDKCVNTKALHEVPVDMNTIFEYSPRSIQQLQNLAGLILGLEGPWYPKWENNGGCCSAVNLNCLAECAYIEEPCPNENLPKVTSRSNRYSSFSEVRAYPNPFNDYIEIQLKSNQLIESIRLINTSGQLIQNIEQINKEHYSIDGSLLNNGLYILEIINNQNKPIIKRIIKN